MGLRPSQKIPEAAGADTASEVGSAAELRAACRPAAAALRRPIVPSLTRGGVKGGTIMRRCGVAIERPKRATCRRSSEPASLLAAERAARGVEGAVGRRPREEGLAALPRRRQRRVDDHRPLEGHAPGRQRLAPVPPDHHELERPRRPAPAPYPHLHDPGGTLRVPVPPSGARCGCLPAHPVTGSEPPGMIASRRSLHVACAAHAGTRSASSRSRFCCRATARRSRATRVRSSGDLSGLRGSEPKGFGDSRSARR